jgi:signal transduction histidine kinase
MSDGKLFDLPRPWPADAVWLGPVGWTADAAVAGDGGAVHHDPAQALAWVRAAVERETSLSRLLIIHQDAFAGHDGAGRLTTWLDDVTSLRAPLLPVLLHGDLPAMQLVEFFRAGLFDALAVPVARADWVNMLIRAEKQIERRHRGRLLLASSGRTRETLRQLQRELGDPEESPAELLQARDSLQTANRQLSEAMAELSLLYRFGRELSAASNWDEVLREILRSLTAFVGAGGAALVLRAAAGGAYSPRQTWQWNESAWDKVLVNLQDQVDAAVTESILAPGIFRVEPGRSPGDAAGQRLIALPLEHQDVRLGYLLLLFVSPETREAVSRRYLPFLQAVRLVLAEEIAGAQHSDRVREVGAFNARVLQTVSSAIWVTDETGRTVYCNRAGQEMLTGQAVEETSPDDALFRVGRGRGHAGPPAAGLPELFLDARLALNAAGPALATLREAPDGAYQGEGEIRRDDGAGIPVQLQTSFMPGRLPGEKWLVVVAEDLRPARRLEAERLRTGRLQSLVEMSATLAHEIRNPLAGLSAQAELLAAQLPEGDPRGRYLDVITREVERINETITRMLNYVRPYEPALAPCALWEAARDALDLVRPRAGAASVSLLLDAGGAADPDAAYTLTADAGQLKQVLLNLLLNAIDAAPAGGQVTLALARHERCDLPDVRAGGHRWGAGLSVEVRDNGPGFRDGDAARLFQPFYTTKSSGTGLGLSLCQKVVNAHGGDIRAERLDGLTVFRVILPADASAALRQKQEEAS